MAIIDVVDLLGICKQSPRTFTLDELHLFMQEHKLDLTKEELQKFFIMLVEDGEITPAATDNATET